MTVTFLAVLDWTARFSRIGHTAVHGPVSPQPLGHVPALAAAVLPGLLPDDVGYRFRGVNRSSGMAGPI